MRPFVKAILIVASSWSSTVATETQEIPAAPAAQFAALLRQYRPVSSGMRKAKTDLDRKAAVELMRTFPPRFVELVEEHSQDPIALEVLRQAIQAVGTTDSAAQITWETNSEDFPSHNRDDSAGKIVAILLRDHLLSDKLGPVCDRMRYGYRLEFEKFLSAALKENPHRDVRAIACLSLAQFLNDRLRMLQLVEDRSELTKCYEIAFGEDYLPKLQQLGRAELAVRIEKLFELAGEEYGDVEIRGSTIAARAESELYDIRHLGIGKVAPEIEGEDQDAQQFKLSDNRGKVVLLYFWSEF